MSQKSEPVFIVQRRALARGNPTWVNVKSADDHDDAQNYVNRMNARAVNFRFRVDPAKVKKL